MQFLAIYMTIGCSILAFCLWTVPRDALQDLRNETGTAKAPLWVLAAAVVALYASAWPIILFWIIGGRIRGDQD